MGCTQSKIENEEIVARCKERKKFMKEAVTGRNAFAAAHSAYAMCLKNTGAALSDYSHGEVSTSVISSGASSLLPSVSQSHYNNTLPPPPPPLPNFSSSPLQRAASMPEIDSAHNTAANLSETVIEEEDEDEVENETRDSLKHRTSRSGGGGISGSGFELTSPPRNSTKFDRTPRPPPHDDSEGVLEYIFPSMANVPGPSLAEIDHQGRIEREEIERSIRVDRVDDGYGGARRSVKAEAAEKPSELPPQPATMIVKKVKQVASAEGKRGGKGATSVNLLQICSDLDDCFLKTSESANEVSMMLEANRLHYHSNFADNRGHIDHSARILRAITWNRSFRGLPNADDGITDDFDSEEHETHATVLDKMLAWEKKLYDEVKTGEQMKIEYQRKVATLNKQKKHGASTESIEKTKATVSRRHTRYIVDMQSMDSTVSEINCLRDEQLYPKLVKLVDGMAKMWEAMKVQHETQKKIATALTFLDISQSPKETTDHHHERTVQLWAVVQEWHSQFHKLMTHQKTYIKALNNWLRLNLIPVDTNLKEKISTPERTPSPPIQTLLQSWQDHLEKLPVELAIMGITNFAAVVHTIVQFQVDEMKLRDKCEETQKELDRKTRKFDEWYNKYMQRRTLSDEVDPEQADDKDLVAERKLVVEMVKQKLEEEEEEYQRQCVQVREKSLTALKTQLLELFKVLSESSSYTSKMYSQLQSITRPRKPNESSQ